MKTQDYFDELYDKINVLMEEGYSNKAIYEELYGEADSEYLTEMIDEIREEQ
jgi:hypothetical protein